jgi:flagellar basal body-associated protein FliL
MRLQRPQLSLQTAVIALSVFALGFWGYGQVLPKWNRYQQLQAAISSAPDSSYIQLEEVIVNLATVPRTRYLCADIAVEVSKTDDLLLAQRFEDKQIVVMDSLVTHLSGKKLDDLLGAKSIEKVRAEVTEKFRQILVPESPEKLKQVLFEKFIVQ